MMCSAAAEHDALYGHDARLRLMMCASRMSGTHRIVAAAGRLKESGKDRKTREKRQGDETPSAAASRGTSLRREAIKTPSTASGPPARRGPRKGPEDLLGFGPTGREPFRAGSLPFYYITSSLLVDRRSRSSALRARTSLPASRVFSRAAGALQASPFPFVPRGTFRPPFPVSAPPFPFVPRGTTPRFPSRLFFRLFGFPG